VGLQKTIACFSTSFSGLFVLELYGGIYLQITETGKILTDVFVTEGAKIFGTKY